MLCFTIKMPPYYISNIIIHVEYNLAVTTASVLDEPGDDYVRVKIIGLYEANCFLECVVTLGCIFTV